MTLRPEKSSVNNAKIDETSRHLISPLENIILPNPSACMSNSPKSNLNMTENNGRMFEENCNPSSSGLRTTDATRAVASSTVKESSSGGFPEDGPGSCNGHNSYKNNNNSSFDSIQYAAAPELRRYDSEHLYDTPHDEVSRSSPLQSSGHNDNMEQFSLNPRRLPAQSSSVSPHMSYQSPYSSHEVVEPYSSQSIVNSQPPFSQRSAPLPRAPSPQSSSHNTTQDSSYDDLGHHYDTPSYLLAQSANAQQKEFSPRSSVVSPALSHSSDRSIVSPYLHCSPSPDVMSPSSRTKSPDISTSQLHGMRRVRSPVLASPLPPVPARILNPPSAAYSQASPQGFAQPSPQQHLSDVSRRSHYSDKPESVASSHRSSIASTSCMTPPDRGGYTSPSHGATTAGRAHINPPHAATTSWRDHLNPSNAATTAGRDHINPSHAATTAGRDVNPSHALSSTAGRNITCHSPVLTRREHLDISHTPNAKQVTFLHLITTLLLISKR